MRAAVELENVSFSYSAQGKNRKILREANLGIERGDFAAIMGNTGSGKTTLLLALNGIIPKLVHGELNGSVFVDGQDVSKKSVQEMSRHVAFVFQDPNDQIFSLTALEEVSFALKLRGLSEGQAHSAARKALREAGLSGFEEEDPTTLSQGQKQKLAIATALAMDTPVMVLDEPVASLDYGGANQVYAILSKLNRKGKTIIVSEHDSEFVFKHATKVFFLEGGRISGPEKPGVLKSAAVERKGLRRIK